MGPEIVREAQQMQRLATRHRRKGRRIAVVPTMGALHEGHRALIREGRRRSDVLVVTIFVNPAQFAPHEDLARYPRTFDADLSMCRDEGVDFVFAPSDETMYPPGYGTYVTVEDLSKGLCGKSRPTHFRGVATVVTKLFLLTQPDAAIFGWKDAQQLVIIRRMARDLHIPVEIVPVETVRDADGLALSSRNKYLSPEERAEAPVLCRSLQNARMLIEKEDIRDTAVLRRAITGQIERESKGRIDYVEIVSLQTLEPLAQIARDNTLIALACYWGSTRLIDNIRV